MHPSHNRAWILIPDAVRFPPPPLQEHLVEQVPNIKLDEGKNLHHINVNALFISIPVDPAIRIIKKKMKPEGELHNRTYMTVGHLQALLEICLKNTYLQIEGAAKG